MNCLKKWTIVGDNVRLSYEEGTLLISKADFDRAFGPIISASYEDVKRDFAIS